MYWLLLAYTQDFPKEKYAEELRDRCEEAALDGYWVRGSSDTCSRPWALHGLHALSDVVESYTR